MSRSNRGAQRSRLDRVLCSVSSSFAASENTISEISADGGNNTVYQLNRDNNSKYIVLHADESGNFTSLTTGVCDNEDYESNYIWNPRDQQQTVITLTSEENLMECVEPRQITINTTNNNAISFVDSTPDNMLQQAATAVTYNTQFSSEQETQQQYAAHHTLPFTHEINSHDLSNGSESMMNDDVIPMTAMRENTIVVSDEVSPTLVSYNAEDEAIRRSRSETPWPRYADDSRSLDADNGSIKCEPSVNTEQISLVPSVQEVEEPFKVDFGDSNTNVSGFLQN